VIRTRSMVWTRYIKCQNQTEPTTLFLHIKLPHYCSQVII